MQKNKLIFITVLAMFLISAGMLQRTVLASVLSIQTLSSYINTNNFKLSCTSDGASAQFYFKKEGGSYAAFGPAIDLASSTCLVQVTSSQITEEAKFYFKVNVDGVDSTETSVIFDNSGPSPVSGYYKDGLSDGFRLHYHTPGDSDFDKVIIYRGDVSGFSADSSHEIASIGGSTNSDMTYENHFSIDSTKTYYYLIRALDHAGNSSALVGDVSTTTQVLGATNAPVSKKVTILPKEGGAGSILGAESTPGASSETATGSVNTNPGLLKWVLTHKKISGGVGLILLATAYLLYRRSKKNN